MNIAIIGRTDILYKTCELLHSKGHKIKLIVTAKEAPEYTKTAHDFEVLAKQLGSAFLNTAQVNKKDNIAIIKQQGIIDICISVNYINVISKEVVDLFPLGILNAHGGDLPKYRGNACQAWAIINGEKEIGLCIHKMVGGELDSGDIIEREYFPINITTKIGDCIDWMRDRIPFLFLSAIEKISNNPDYILTKQSQRQNDILRGYPRLPEDGRINWGLDCISIMRLINASNKPYSGAFCYFSGEKLIIWDAEVVEDGERYLAVNGQVSFVNKEDKSIVVICGKGKIKIKRVEYNNQVMEPAGLIKSIRCRLN